MSRHHYESSRGWFWTCNTPLCQANKARMNVDLAAYSVLRAEEHELMKDAKQSVGLFSEHGVQDTREMFWQKFQSGKDFASRQTKWDIIFAGISAIGRDEKIANFLFRIVSSFLLNITIGLCGAVVAFWWNLWSLIQVRGRKTRGPRPGLASFCVPHVLTPLPPPHRSTVRGCSRDCSTSAPRDWRPAPLHCCGSSASTPLLPARCSSRPRCWLRMCVWRTHEIGPAGTSAKTRGGKTAAAAAEEAAAAVDGEAAVWHGLCSSGYGIFREKGRKGERPLHAHLCLLLTRYIITPPHHLLSSPQRCQHNPSHNNP